MDFADLPPEIAAGLAAVWVTTIGGAVGSFLNVVVYRVPAGLSIVRPPSHCPKCKHPIRWYDNVPVFGWLALRGRCRDCGTRIAARYPTVEAVCAAMFLLLAAIVWQTGGESLPARAVTVAGGTIAPGLSLGQIGGLYVYHMVLLCTLLAAALIEYDGHGLPTKLFAPALAVGFAAPLVWPWLHPVPAWGAGEGLAAGLIDGAAGLATGAAMGWLTAVMAGRKRPAGLWLAPACAGLFLGWQAAIALGVATCLAAAVLRVVGRRVPVIGVLWLLTVVWIAAWSQIASAWGMVG